MDYRNAFAISATGMNVEKLRLDTTANNIANLHSTKGADGKLYRPLNVKVVEANDNFSLDFERLSGANLRGVQVAKVEELDVAPRKVYEPGNPDADDKGYVSMPGINHVTEMVNISTALRAYEANVVAMNAAKRMALKALELGGS
ncbi:flagellar basal-body rod protein FlgC (plasmid) [Undibacterium sp. YM2]|uniref:flagellar basal body rod protein FlgC n=1 Tax=Undibacterium sp. YM2 TaxID=2058625 RepID=UPI001331F568|nr:flagellar basal body rod protein FlgC [Undibacterium sp. YM2]BBB70247.1 flagellar basal-body rod protein FlgC [Undibacterium sp. YM2]